MKQLLPSRLFLNVAAIAWCVVVLSPLAKGGVNNDELRYSLKHDLLARINADRSAHGLSPVQMDPEASAIADRYCEKQLRNRTTGHYTIDGEAPYMRYSFAGGNDGVSENAAAWSANYAFADDSLSQLVQKSEDAMMAERPPHDGHRRTILDPYATHVGIGIAWRDGEFRMVQEFIRRYVEWTRPLPRAAEVRERVSGKGRAFDGYSVEAVSVYHEDLPQPMAMQVANAIDTYALPKSRRDYMPADARARNAALVAYADGTFTFSVPMIDGPGVYTVVVWVAREGTRTPIAASNVSIRVDSPLTPGGFGASTR